MKNVYVFRFTAIFLLLGAAITFMANSSGPAANGNFYTGAPSAGGGTELTCSTCHSSGSFGEPLLAVTFTDEDGEVASPDLYLPGRTYSVTVAVGHAAAAPAGYGFQSQILDANNSVIGTLAMPSAGVQISDGPSGSGRKYAEHSTISNDSTFTFEWTAPEVGAGEVKMYVVGNLVNRASATGGDNGSTTPLILTLIEGTQVSTNDPGFAESKLFPNPATGPVSLRVRPESAGNYTLRVRDIAGRELSSNVHQLTASDQQISVPTDGLKPGFYLIELSGVDSRLVKRMVLR